MLSSNRPMRTKAYTMTALQMRRTQALAKRINAGMYLLTGLAHLAEKALKSGLLSEYKALRRAQTSASRKLKRMAKA